MILKEQKKALYHRVMLCEKKYKQTKDPVWLIRSADAFDLLLAISGLLKQGEK